MLGIGLAGYGYWGPKLLRNFMTTPGAKVIGVCDLQADRLSEIRTVYPMMHVTPEFETLIRHPGIDAIVIATPISTHFKLALAALQAGKHVFVEKPMTETTDEALSLIREAKRCQRTLMVGHTFIYSGAVQKMKELLKGGEIGEVYYYDSVRINLGRFQDDANVMWDLAVHDLSIMDYLMPVRPSAVIANGMHHIPGQPENMAYLTFLYNRPLMAHLHVNWLAPLKIRRTLIGGSRKMIVYDDLAPSEKVMVYDRGVTFDHDRNAACQNRVGYRSGDMWAPQISNTEPLKAEAQHFVRCVESGEEALSGGMSALWIIRVLEAASLSLEKHGQRVEIAPI